MQPADPKPFPKTSRSLSWAVFLLCALFLAFCFAPAALAQDPAPETTESPESEENSARKELEDISVLLTLFADQETRLLKELESLKSAPSTRSVESRRQEILQQLDQLYFNFEAVATRHSTTDMGLEEDGKKGWMNELEELTLPLLQALSDFTSKPRRIEKLKNKVAQLESKIKLLNESHNKITALLEAAKPADGELSPQKQQLVSRLQSLKAKYSPEMYEFELREAQRQLAQELADNRPIIDIVSESVKSFLKNRGLNLLITLGTFALLWWISLGFRTIIVGRRSPFNFAPRIKKVLRVGYNALAFTFCLGSSLTALYLLNDWLLLSIVIIALLGVAWTSRQLVPKFFREMQMALNLGTVRENERLVWNGVPWRVRSIGISAKLENEKLEEGLIILPLRELVDKHSRGVVENEDWFPTSTGDWVLLSDGTYGQVQRQTQEQVILKLKGDSLKYYRTAEFLELTPTNLSCGFRYDIDFNLDYSIQNRICDDVPGIFESGLKSWLASRFEGDDPDFTRLEVGLDHAGSSSLVLKVILHVEGRCAEFYEEYHREVQRALVSICNENHMKIPFNQLTVSLSENPPTLPTRPAKE